MPIWRRYEFQLRDLHLVENRIFLKGQMTGGSSQSSGFEVVLLITTTWHLPACHKLVPVLRWPSNMQFCLLNSLTSYDQPACLFKFLLPLLKRFSFESLHLISANMWYIGEPLCPLLLPRTRMAEADIKLFAVVLFPECWWSGWVSQAPGFLGWVGVCQKKLAEAPSLLLALVLRLPALSFSSQILPQIRILVTHCCCCQQIGRTGLFTNCQKTSYKC